MKRALYTPGFSVTSKKISRTCIYYKDMSKGLEAILGKYVSFARGKA